tara:strand:+ start:2849 stop:3298 length:450 start_codon:yes stop_codon:yes gene_type:complete
MKNFIILIKIVFIFFYLTIDTLSKESEYLKDGVKLFKNKEFKKSKLLFEKDIVFDPRSEKSYLYLAKIFNKDENDEEEEINLNSVLLLNPKNDEAIYMLALLKIKQSNYDEAKKLLVEFTLVCKSFCTKKEEIEEKFEKLIPANAKDNN